MLQEPAIQATPVRPRHHVSRLLEDCVRRIREKSGFEQFLQPASVCELLRSAAENPIVIVNLTVISSDAIILSGSTVEVVTLPVEASTAPKHVQNMLRKQRTVASDHPERDVENEVPYEHNSDTLSWLWSTCVSPVLARLAEQQPSGKRSNKPRI